MPKPKHILVIRLSAMGDVAMTVPVLRAFTEQYPTIKLTVLTREFFKPFFRDLKNVDVFSADLKNKHQGIFGLYKLSRELKHLGIDAVADLHNVLRSNILKFFFFGLEIVQIDKGRDEKKALVTGKNFEQLITTHQRYAYVFEKLGFPLDLSNPTFPQRSELNSKIQSVVGENRAYKWIGIAPFAAHEGKMYPLKLMEKVITALSKNNRIILFGGGEQEIQTLNALEHQFDNVINVAGMLTLEEELDLISNLDLMYSMDSGNGHLAAMLGIKVVTLWGVTHPFAGFAPFHQPEEYSLLANRNIYPLIPTAVYGNEFPESYKDCMKTISPAEIINKIELIL
ncbi:MAG: glycosyltransferase family 9 protein [Aquaticitalea sp.]